MKYQIVIKDGNGFTHVLETHDYLPKAQERFTRLELANNLRSGETILIVDPQWESIELQSVHVLEESEIGMTTAIATSPIFYTVYQQQSSPSSPSPSPLPYFRVIGAYSDIRDAIQAIASNYRRRGGHYSIESSPNRPKHWVHSTKYK